jgi:hypothetical protein
VARELAQVPDLRLPYRPPAEGIVGSSIQFNLPGFNAVPIQSFLGRAHERVVELKWFGASEPAGYTSRHWSWAYLDGHEWVVSV